MSWTDSVSYEFEPSVRKRGNDYFRKRAVQIVQVDRDVVHALVYGTEDYWVVLSVGGRDLRVSCTCPYFESDTCKHIWATILAAEKRGWPGWFEGDFAEIRMLDPLIHGDLKLREQHLRDGELDEEEDVDDIDEDDDPEEEGNGYQSDNRLAARNRYAPRQPDSRANLRMETWEYGLEQVESLMLGTRSYSSATWSPNQTLYYVISVSDTLSGRGLGVNLGVRVLKKSGEWGKIRTSGVPRVEIRELPEAADRRIISLMTGARAYTFGSYPGHETLLSSYTLSYSAAETLLPLMCSTGRCLLQASGANGEISTLEWDDGPPWEFWLEAAPHDPGQPYRVQGSLRRGSEKRPLSEPLMLFIGGFVFDKEKVARLNDFGAFPLISFLRERGPLPVRPEKIDTMLSKVLQLPHTPPLDLPTEFHFDEMTLTPQPQLRIRKPDKASLDRDILRADLSFDYGGMIVQPEHRGQGVFEAESRRVFRRNLEAEREASNRLLRLKIRDLYDYAKSKPTLGFHQNDLARVVRTLINEGWHVEAEGALYRRPGEVRLEVTSGIDWFELHGSVEFGETKAGLPELLAALRRGESTVRLDDGTWGMLPEEWLKKYGVLAALGSSEEDHLRFSRSQAGLLDALLASQPLATFDEGFARTRDELKRFDGVRIAEAPTGFEGTLRGYQKEGLGWLHFLRQFSFGGCLADDMGLGKTVQVLALLEERREQREEALRSRSKRKKKTAEEVLPPSLVVMPKSLIFNWKQEAARFAPKLKVLEHVGVDRIKAVDHFDDYDLIITTYGTLRRDAIQFKDKRFDYIVLDEAQAVKNASTESSKATRLLKGNHRLALSGTPVENHLGELWTLFDFLNPGLLGSASVFNLTAAGGRNPDQETRTLLARALRPFILRRTKQQVAKDLPDKLEQTVYCELESSQRKLYNELRDHYRRSLLGLVEKKGIKQSKIQILEALLRLRQAACHPGLIDKTRSDESSAKLDALLPQLAEVTAEGHKALVFSQFTSFLSIVRARLDREKIPYAYLDGKTRDRAAQVTRFQESNECKLFLISLKAGGLGLNLTAAEYVFLLDPWWNPAVEAQAIDRAHRIGQIRQVFAYRLIAQDTVEEKVLELQQTKRELADAVINADNSLIRDLGREDLELLLS